MMMGMIVMELVIVMEIIGVDVMGEKVILMMMVHKVEKVVMGLMLMVVVVVVVTMVLIAVGMMMGIEVVLVTHYLQ